MKPLQSKEGNTGEELTADHTYAQGRGLGAGPDDPEATVLPFQ